MKSSGVIYRLGRVPDPWAVPDWASAGPDGTFGNRFDDPDATYRVLYASSQKANGPQAIACGPSGGLFEIYQEVVTLRVPLRDLRCGHFGELRVLTIAGTGTT